jgi:RHS repeat-associated protein
MENILGMKIVHPKFYYAADFNGDGKMEILAVSNFNSSVSTATSKCYLFDLNTGAKLYEGSVFNFLKSSMFGKSTNRLHIADFDGDGKSEICLINANGTSIYKFAISGSTYSLQQVSAYTELNSAAIENRQLLLGELNGDGKPDFLLSPLLNNNTWNVFYGKGDGSFYRETFQSATNQAESDNAALFLLQDVNGDGVSDLIKYYSNHIYTWLAKNSKFSTGYDNAKKAHSSNWILLPADINNKNDFSQLLTLKDDLVTKYFFLRNDTQEKLLTGTASSLSLIRKIYYQALDDKRTILNNQGNSIYTKGAVPLADYPNVDFSGHLFVTGRVDQYFNGQLNESAAYTYAGAVVHKQGLGFRGFSKITVTDQIRNRTSTGEFDPIRFGIPKREDSPESTTTYNGTVTIAADKRVQIKINTLATKDKTRNVTVNTTYSSYDACGNPGLITVNYGDGVTETITSSYYNNTAESAYLIGLPTDRTKVTARNGQTCSERVHLPSGYSKGNPVEIITYANGTAVSNQVLYERFSYNSKGLPTSKRIQTYGSSNPLVTTCQYDEYGRLTSKRTPAGQTTTYHYWGDSGLLLDITNHFGKKRIFNYDSFGRNTLTYNFDDTSETYTCSWNADGLNGLYSIAANATGKPGARISYDALGRETRRSLTQFNGTKSHLDKLYDSYGCLQKVSLPFTGSSASQWNTYYYDNYSRLYFLLEASGRTTRITYSGTSVTETADSITITRKYDNSGHLTEVTDPGGTIRYNLRPDGKPSSVIAPGNTLTSFEYDRYGRKWKIHDPSTGTQTFEYDSSGRLYSQTNANNQTVTCLYDSYNRLKTKQHPEFTTEYTYNPNGLLESETSTNSTSKTYTYDEYGRLSAETETAPDDKYLKKTYYYTGGNLASTGYYDRNGTYISHEDYLYQNGHLSEMTVWGGHTIWKLNAVNAAGQPVSVTTGNFSRNYSYDSYGYPTRRTAGNFQNLTTTFNPKTGNLKTRTNHIRSHTENFAYDNLNRLTSYFSGTAQYDTQGKGNITQRSETGNTFYYNTPGKPYAISEIDVSPGAIPLHNQKIAYTSFNRPCKITENGYTAGFTYNSDGNRVKMALTKDSLKELTRYYLGGVYEIDDQKTGGIKEKLYIGGNYYTAPAVLVRNNCGGWQLHHICRDHQGSITHLANNMGDIVQELSYNAWGQMRNTHNREIYTPGSEPEPLLGRGYTGHEHLPKFGLINMNARLYDPALGRFLSPDPFIQPPTSARASTNNLLVC